MFKDMLGRIIWWRVIAVVLVLAVLAYFAIDFALNEPSTPPGQSNVPVEVQEVTELAPIVGDPVSFIALATSSSYQCDAGLCIEVETAGSRPIVYYDKSYGSFTKGAQVYVEGVAFGDGVTANDIFMIETYEYE